MSYVKKPSRANVAPNHEVLVKAIEKEFEDEKSIAQMALDLNQPYEKPYIIEGTLRHSDKLEVYVVWNGWTDVREDHRTTAILDAYDRAFGPKKRVVIAWE